jgi:hypothetical protein
MSRNDPRKWYGTFRAVVVEVKDPMFLDRVRVRIPEILGNTVTDWAWPKSAVVNCSWKPIVGSRVWVEFENGDIDRPIYSGSWYSLDKKDKNKSLIPLEVLENNKADYTRTRIIKSPAGHKILVKDPDPDDAAAEKGITIQTVGGHKIELQDGTDDNKVSVETPGGHKVELSDKDTTLKIVHSNGTSKIEIDNAGKVTITANGDIELLGGGVLPPAFPVVCAGTPQHFCAFTGGPHPAGSINVKASQ